VNRTEWARAIRERTRGEVSFLSLDELVALLWAALDVLSEELTREGLISIYHFGTFEVVEVPARRNYDGLKGEWRVLPAYVTVRFKPSPSLIGDCQSKRNVTDRSESHLTVESSNNA
jgi:nucleoid DNA-binding protein